MCKNGNLAEAQNATQGELALGVNPDSSAPSSAAQSLPPKLGASCSAPAPAERTG